MFCPKCGTNNPEDGKFCRKCGTDLKFVSLALTGKISVAQNKIQKKEKDDLSGSFSSLFGGLAFLTISIILAGQPMGRGWWFWLLIPAFTMIGKGVASIIQMKNQNKKNLSGIELDNTENLKGFDVNESKNLPSAQTEFVSNIPDAIYETGDLVPPSVVENTTRHLKINSEGETMTLPKDKN